MSRLRIGVLDLVTKSRPSLYGRVMNANLASIMPQVVANWCERAGHDVQFICYTGIEDLAKELPQDLDLLFVGAFTQSAHLAYAVSHMFRRRGAVTVIGGPHARCYPEDSARHFDYVLGFTDEDTVRTVLDECVPHRPEGALLSALRQPLTLPTLPERWKYVEATLKKAPTIKIVPMIGSLGCPYTCSFCIDSTVDYQPLGFAQLRDDLKFLLTKMERPIVGWHDPNFGVRFDDYMNAVEEADPHHKMRHIAESSLSLLSEPHLVRLKQNGFQAILPGIESWYDMGNKSKTRRTGLDKVNEVSEHVNMVMRYVPYVQTNFVMGLDCDEGTEPFELTKLFLDKTPGAFPAYSLLSAFGRAAPLNLEYQRAGRVLPFPFHFLNNNHAMNVRPKNYQWPEFYDGVIDVSRHSFSWRAIGRRFAATRTAIPKWINVLRAVSSEGFGRIAYHTMMRNKIETDRPLRDFWEGESNVLPEFYRSRIQNELGPFYEFLPQDDGHMHDQNAYLRATEHGDTAGVVTIQRRPRRAAAGAAAEAPQQVM